MVFISETKKKSVGCKIAIFILFSSFYALYASFTIFRIVKKFSFFFLSTVNQLTLLSVSFYSRLCTASIFVKLNSDVCAIVLWKVAYKQCCLNMLKIFVIHPPISSQNIWKLQKGRRKDSSSDCLMYFFPHSSSLYVKLWALKLVLFIAIAHFVKQGREYKFEFLEFRCRKHYWVAFSFSSYPCYLFKQTKNKL